MKKIKTYAFWVALSGSIVILVESVANLFGFSIDSSTIENVIMAICGVLVVLGIVTKDSKSSKQKTAETTEPQSCSEKEKTDNCENIDLVVNDEAIKKIDNTVKTSNDAIGLIGSGVEIINNAIESIDNIEKDVEDNKTLVNDCIDDCKIVDNDNIESDINNCDVESNFDFGDVVSGSDDCSAESKVCEKVESRANATCDVAENEFSKQQSINNIVLKILALLESNSDLADIVKGAESIGQKDESTVFGDSQHDCNGVESNYNGCPENDYNNGENYENDNGAIIDEVADDLSNEQVSDEAQKVVRRCVDIRRS